MVRPVRDANGIIPGENMEKLYIICVDDQREVLHNINRDLRVFGSWTVVEECESAMEAGELLEELSANGVPVAVVICDHIPSPPFLFPQKSDEVKNPAHRRGFCFSLVWRYLPEYP